MKQNQGLSVTDVSSDTLSMAALAPTATVAGIPGRTLVDSLTSVFNTNRELEEAIVSTRRFTSLTGALADHSAAIIQQGAVGIDLFGNITADFVVEVREATTEHILSVNGLFDSSDKPETDATIIKLSWCPRMAAAGGAIQSAVRAELDVAGLLRQATKGETTVVEGDDTARFVHIHARGESSLELVSQDDLIPETYQIELARGHGATPYQLSGPTNGAGTLLFGSAAQAMSVVRWLRETNSPGLPGLPLTLGLESYNPKDANLLEVCRVYWLDDKRVCGSL